MVNTQSLTNHIISLNKTYAFKIRMYLDHDKFRDPKILIEWLTSRYSAPTSWTYGEETSLKSKRLHYHLHLLIETTKDLCFTKTPLMQLFKTWYNRQYPKGIPLEKNSFSIKYEPQLKNRNDFLMYPLKTQDHIVKNHNYFNVPDHQELLASAQTLFRKKIEYINGKVLKEEARSNTWKSLSVYVDNELSSDPRWDVIISLSENTEDEEYLGVVQSIDKASRIIGCYMIKYYRNHHDCEVPYNIKKYVLKYLMQKNLVHDWQVYNILS